MTGNIKYGKILVVVFITVLIWVWADLAKTEELTVSNATISVAKSTAPGLWVNFNEKSSVSISKVVLKGSASKIADVARKLKDARLTFDFALDVAQQGMDSPGEHTLIVADFLKKTDLIRHLGLTVESCQPEIILVNVVGLVKRTLNVRCVNEDQITIDAAVEPAQVEAPVPENWSGYAEVKLTPLEIKQARASAIEKIPYIELATGQTRQTPTTIKITIPPEEDLLRLDTITAARLGYTLSTNLQGKYRVEVTNLTEVMSPIAIRGTPEAKRTYEGMLYQVILEIDDEDAKAAEPLRKELIYNFPDKYLRKDEIKLNQPPVIVRFKLIPLPSAR